MLGNKLEAFMALPFDWPQEVLKGMHHNVEKANVVIVYDNMYGESLHGTLQVDNMVIDDNLGSWWPDRNEIQRHVYVWIDSKWVKVYSIGRSK